MDVLQHELEQFIFDLEEQLGKLLAEALNRKIDLLPFQQYWMYWKDVKAKLFAILQDIREEDASSCWKALQAARLLRRVHTKEYTQETCEETFFTYLELLQSLLRSWKGVASIVPWWDDHDQYSSELRNCPFCGRCAYLQPEDSGKWIARCRFCGCQIIADTREKVVLAWNQRFLDTRIGKTQKLLSDALFTIGMGGALDD